MTVNTLLGDTTNPANHPENRFAENGDGDLLSSDRLDNPAAVCEENIPRPDAGRKVFPQHSGEASLPGGAEREWSPEVMDPVTGMLYVHDPVESNFDETTKKRMKQKIEAYKAFEKRAGTDLVPLLIPLSYPAASESGTLLSRELRMSGGIGTAGITDPICFFESKGVPVIEMVLPSGRDSWSVWDPGRQKPFIFLQSRTTVERKRFRVVYEMGYVIRYISRGGRRTIPDIKGSRLVSRTFAASFLLPEEAVRESAYRLAIGKEDWTWDLLIYAKDRFGVSAETFLHRIEELRLITDLLKKTLLKKLEEHYTACRHAGETDIEPKPTRPGHGCLYELQLRARANGKETSIL